VILNTQAVIEATASTSHCCYLHCCQLMWHMTRDDQDLLDLLTFELKFLENEGYGRSPHTPWRRQPHLNPVKTVLSFEVCWPLK